MSAIRLSPDCRDFSIPERCRAPCKAAAHRFEHDHVAALDPPVANRGVERQRNRGRRSVGMLVDRDHDLRRRKPELSCAVASRIRALAWCGTTQSTSSAVRPAASSTSFSTSARLTTAWRNTSRPFIRSLPTVPVVEGPPSTNSRSLWRPSAWSLVARMPRSPSSALEHQRAGAVAEQHAGRAVLPVEDPAERLRADHQRLLRIAAAQHRVGDASAHRGSRCTRRGRRTRCNRRSRASPGPWSPTTGRSGRGSRWRGR